MTTTGRQGDPLGRPFVPVRLGELARQGIPKPEFIADGMLYRGHLHVLFGESESGKTTMAAWWMRGELRAGYPVVFLDEESGSEQVVEKLDAIGLTPDEMDMIDYFPFPGRQWDRADLLGWHHQISRVRPRLLVVDSSGGVLAAAGRDENVARDVREVYKPVLLETAREYGMAVVLIDHVPKVDNGRRYAKGSADKLNIVDNGYRAETISPWDRERSGLFKLTCTKDRRGYVGQGRAWEVRVLVGGGAVELELDRAEQLAITDGLSPAARKVLEVLQGSVVALTVGLIGDEVARKHPPGLRRETIQKALTVLCQDGRVDRADPSSGGAAYWSAVRP